MPPQSQQPEPPVAVMAVVERHGELLAVRWRRPAERAARWGLPAIIAPVDEPAEPARGAPGERRHAVALHGLPAVTVEPVELIEGSGPTDGPVRRAWRCVLVRDTEPTQADPGDDVDEVRWLAPEDLAEVDWLAADRPVALGRYEALMAGTPLAGGRVGGAVRVGATVRRPTGPWTPAVHDLIRHLGDAGLDGVPAVLGRDGWDREVLSYLPGLPAPTDRPASAALIADVGAWLARCHAAAATFPREPVRTWRRGAIPLRPGGVVCHNDVSLHNVVVRGGRLAGVVDWDMAAPGHRLDDVAFAAWQLVLRHGAAPTDEAAGVATLAAAYGTEPLAVLDRVVPRLRGAVGFIRRGAAAGDPGLATLLRSGIPAATEAGAVALQGRSDALRRLLRASGRVGQRDPSR